ncbi:unnamed protein product [Durusdinium trenchii]|uniref:Protein kinase domain-containing protein n=1 Tax=Durusdinium trenchii TaxID=1381693 RepID=A0ABP0IAQ0_9DINO
MNGIEMQTGSLPRGKKRPRPHSPSDTAEAKSKLRPDQGSAVSEGTNGRGETRRSNPSRGALPPPRGLSCKGPVPEADQSEDAELRLGCFEMQTTEVKRLRPNSPSVKAPLAAAPKPPAPGPKPKPPVPKVDVEAAQLAKEQTQRREREYFKPYIGEPCGPENRFLVEGPLGRGSFSSVFRCSDTKGRGKEYAVKFIRDNPGLRKATEAEVRLMRRIRTKAVEKDSEGANCLLGLAGVETFMHHGHLALIFHLQRYDLRTALRRLGERRGFPLQDLERYAGDLFLALRALRAIRIIHTDIKPDNLLMSLDKKSVKLSDFGCAIDTQDEVQIKHIRRAYASSYRAPEIILGQSYSTRADMWSAAATLFELADGRVLFAESSNNTMLYDMLKTCGPFKKAFATVGKNSLKHFSIEGDFKRRKTDGNEQLLPMRRFAKPAKPPLLSRLREKLEDVRLDHFAGLLSKCLVPEPAQRLAPEDALQHDFLRSSR